MTRIRFPLWFLCLAVLVSAVLVKLTLMIDSPGKILMIWTPLIFLGPKSGVVIDRHQGGTGRVGGFVGGLLTGATLATMANVSLMRAGHAFDLAEFLFTTTVTIALLAFIRWMWGWLSNPRSIAKTKPVPADDLGEVQG